MKPKDEFLINIPEYGDVLLSVNHSFDFNSKRIVKGMLGNNKKGVFWFTSKKNNKNLIGFVEVTSEDKFMKLILEKGLIKTKIDTISNTRCTDIRFATDEELKKQYVAAYEAIYTGPVVEKEILALGYLTNAEGNEPKITPLIFIGIRNFILIPVIKERKKLFIWILTATKSLLIVHGELIVKRKELKVVLTI